MRTRAERDEASGWSRERSNKEALTQSSNLQWEAREIAGSLRHWVKLTVVRLL